MTFPGFLGQDTLVSIEHLTMGNGDDTLTGNAEVNAFFAGGGNDILSGRDGGDQLHGGDGNDQFFGDNGSGSLKDTASNAFAGLSSGYSFVTQSASIRNLVGTSHNDALVGTPGNDTLNGGSGLDTAWFVGARADYRFDLGLDGSYTSGTVRDLRDGSPEGTDTLTGIEYLRFSEGPISLPEYSLGAQIALDSFGTQVYRFAKLDNGQYFYTGSAAERDQINATLPNFRYEGASFYVPEAPGPDTAPVYRLANLRTGGYLFTSSGEERWFAASLGFWRDEGVAFNAPRVGFQLKFSAEFNGFGDATDDGSVGANQVLDDDSAGSLIAWSDGQDQSVSLVGDGPASGGWLV